MEDRELINLWKAQHDKIEQSLSINRRLLEETIHQKAHNALNPLKRLKTGGMVAFILYLIVLGYVLFYAISNYSSAANYFIVSMSAIALINLKGFTDYVRHLIWVNTIDYDGPVTEIQQKLLKLQLSIISHARTMVLQLPFWTTFYLSDTWFPHSVGLQYILFQVILTSAFTYLAYWLYKNQTAENLDKKWFQKLIAGSGGKSVAKALALYKEVEAFRQE
ncbi:hypothetical protein [uncultured Pontibacter sp.]|uniref:hypothetical protein n=1 Tax=uncultured Pontibacter sp. TaxID=453356 RepID=UPI002616B9BE|nr:hypothetical protein [uncultured Pontibacter sp.]